MYTTKRILYFTTGLISLINTLALRSEKRRNENTPDCIEVFLIADKSVGNDAFFAFHEEIVRHFGIKHVYASNDFSLRTLTSDFPPESFDEVYILSHVHIPPTTLERFTTAEMFWVDEGLSSYIDYFSYANRIKCAYFPIFNGKFDFLNANGLRIEPIDKNAILRVTTEIAPEHPLDYAFSPNDRVVVFLGQYLFAPLGKQALIDMHVAVFNKLLSAGYKIFFKPHPRSVGEFVQTLASLFDAEDVHFSANRMPIEIYDMPATAIVSFSSGSLLTMSHLYSLPAFYIPCDEEFAHESIYKFDLLYYELIKGYIPPIEKMLAFGNAHDHDPASCRSALWRIFADATRNAPLLSENRAFDGLRARVGEYLDAFMAGRLPAPPASPAIPPPVLPVASLEKLKRQHFRCSILEKIFFGKWKSHYRKKCARLKSAIIAMQPQNHG